MRKNNLILIEYCHKHYHYSRLWLKQNSTWSCSRALDNNFLNWTSVSYNCCYNKKYYGISLICLKKRKRKQETKKKPYFINCKLITKSCFILLSKYLYQNSTKNKIKFVFYQLIVFKVLPKAQILFYRNRKNDFVSNGLLVSQHFISFTQNFFIFFIFFSALVCVCTLLYCTVLWVYEYIGTRISS